MSMPGYVAESLNKHQHKIAQRKLHSPHNGSEPDMILDNKWHANWTHQPYYQRKDKCAPNKFWSPYYIMKGNLTPI